MEKATPGSLLRSSSDGKGHPRIPAAEFLRWKRHGKDTLNSKRTWSVATALAWCCEHVANVLNTPYQTRIPAAEFGDALGLSHPPHVNIFGSSEGKGTPIIPLPCLHI